VDTDHLEEIGNDRNVNVGGKEAIEIGGSQSVTVNGDVIYAFKANHSEQTGSNYYLKAMGVIIESMTGITLKCGGSNVVIDQMGVTIKGAIVTVDGAMIKIASGPGSPPAVGSAASAVAPAVPGAILEADFADPGKIPELKALTAKEQLEEKPHKQDEEKKSWIEIELIDEEDNPVPGEQYKITLPDGSVKTGTLDQNGFARVDGIDPGTCKVTFPNLDKEAWEQA
jgi:type VI secretion system secreted protein VgrG